MKKTLLVFTLMLLVLSIVPAAFAQDTEEEESVSRADADFVIWAHLEYADSDELQDIADTFSEDFGITVAVQKIDAFEVASDVMPVAAPAGQGPDILMMPHDRLGGLVTGGLVAPVEIADTDAFYPSAISAFNYNGEIYGMPFNVENIAFVRNVDIVPNAPETWDEVLEISRELAADNDDDFETNVYGFVRMEGDPYHFFPIQTAFGGYVFGLNEDGSYNPLDVGLGNDGSIAAAELYATLVAEGLQPPGVDWDLMHAMFYSGQSAMTITGPWALDPIRESGINYAISNLPSQDQEGQPFIGVWGFTVNSFSEQQLLAGIFLNEYIANDDAMLALYEANKRPSAFISANELIEDADLVSFGAAGVNGLPMPAIPEMAQVWDAWANAVVLVAQEAEEPAAAFTNAGEQVDTLIEESAQN